MSKRRIMTDDLTSAEQENVRAALVFLYAKLEGWKPVAKLLKYEHKSLTDIVHRRRNANASLAFRLARIAGVGIDDLLGGRYPEPGICPHCGQKDARLAIDKEDTR